MLRRIQDSAGTAGGRKLAACLLALVSTAMLAAGCGPGAADKPSEKPELLVYCGITMIKPMSEIAAIIEREHGCNITLTKDGSGNLLRSIRANGFGDLYLPGSPSYIDSCDAGGLIAERALVGHNRAALMVAKGNPLGITGDLANLTKPEYRVVLGNPTSGSIGKETKRILAEAGLLEAAMANAWRLTTDSKELGLLLRDGQADLVMNWRAVATWPENRDHIEIVPITDSAVRPKALVLAVLASSKHPDIAKAFLEYASSGAGARIFDEHGLFAAD